MGPEHACSKLFIYRMLPSPVKISFADPGCYPGSRIRIFSRSGSLIINKKSRKKISCLTLFCSNIYFTQVKY
jgi:hypothetical protein